MLREQCARKLPHATVKGQSGLLTSMYSSYTTGAEKWRDAPGLKGADSEPGETVMLERAMAKMI
jgi:hypothetical protein